jgi:hypothetical protein
MNSNITWEIIQYNPDKPWNWYCISFNPNITWEIIQDNTDKDWDWCRISSNINITWEIIRDNPDKPWNWFSISSNINITWEIIRDNPDKPWNWFSISQNTFNYNKKIKEYKDQAARIIQHHVKHWLYSAPNGPMFLREIKKLQIDGLFT